MNRRVSTKASLVVLWLLAWGCASPRSPIVDAPHQADTHSETIADALEPSAFMDRYSLSRCPLCNTALGARGEAVEIIHQDRHYRVCSRACHDEFKRDPASAISRIDAALIADQRPHYPLATSLFNRRPLPEKPIDFIWGNRLFRAIDAAERDRILKDPITAIRVLDRAVIEAQRPTYGMPDKCPVQGDILPTEARIDIVVANRMIRVCCTRCVRVVKARPYQYLAMVEYANRAAAEARPAEHTPVPQR